MLRAGRVYFQQAVRRSINTSPVDNRRVFQTLDPDGDGNVPLADLDAYLEDVGIESNTDPRLHKYRQMVKSLNKPQITLSEYADIMVKADCQKIFDKAVTGNLVVPSWKSFTESIKSIYEVTKNNRQGEVVSYIPELASIDGEKFGVSVCTVDGQRFSIGDANTLFSLQSCSKPITYCLVRELFGEEKVHRYVGREPSGKNFNAISLNADGLPHNPMINSGALICSSLIPKTGNDR
jgi:glutaminase